MNTTSSLGSGVGTTCPRAGSRCETLAVKYLASLNFLICSSVTEEAIHHLRLHVEDLEPQPEVALDAEEGLTHDNDCRDVEEGVRG